MDDRFMNSLRRDPSPDFARDLRRSLRAQESPRRAGPLRPLPALATAAALALVVSLFVFPSVRASAQAFLDLFRVRQFAAVQFDESRIEQLRALDGESALAVFDRRETVVDPGPARPYATVEAAGAAAGIEALRPTLFPGGLAPDSVFVEGAAEARLSVSEARLRSLLDALDLRDVVVPMGLDGRVVEVRKPPVVVQRFTGGRRKAALVQAASPEVSVPAGFDVERLAEVGLRILGLDEGEARRVARSTDWRSTLVVPVPTNAATFRQVTVHGRPGLLITTVGRRTEDGDRHYDGATVLWTENERVFGLTGNLGADDVLQMAESVR